MPPRGDAVPTKGLAPRTPRQKWYQVPGTIQYVYATCDYIAVRRSVEFGDGKVTTANIKKDLSYRKPPHRAICLHRIPITPLDAPTSTSSRRSAT